MRQKTASLKTILCILVLVFSGFMEAHAQVGTLHGQVTSNQMPVPYAQVVLKNTSFGTVTDSLGRFQLDNVPYGSYTLLATSLGYQPSSRTLRWQGQSQKPMLIELQATNTQLQDVVVSGTMKEMSKLDSPVPVEVYNAQFFKNNPTPTLFDALQNINGVRPQINCNVCNTGDVHINGLEGPYTMILIDGMPIVSGLASVYGLSGIPQALIDRIEVVKGPASTLYGSEAVGGLINVITKNPYKTPRVSVDTWGTSWGELSSDISLKTKISPKTRSLWGINYFNYQNRIDRNEDGFTDLTLQNRIALFNKWTRERPQERIASTAIRYVYEDRFGGDMRWNKTHRGGDQIYGESIFTSRWEWLGTYQLPLREKIMLQWSANSHHQNSVYGTTLYQALQNIGFGQMYWDKKTFRNDFLLGVAYRYTWYDDNTPATRAFDSLGTNQPSIIQLPGAFAQDEVYLSPQSKLLVGLRYDLNSVHGSIISPRFNYKWNSKNKLSTMRVSIGNGYRVANVFTEDHAALTGARQVVFVSNLKPETSWNANLNWVQKLYSTDGNYMSIDATAFYTYFTNKIIADYDTDPNQIIYDNLNGYALSRGISTNLDIALANGWKSMVGATLMDVSSVEDGVRTRQLLTERFSGVWSVGYTLRPWRVSIDYTGNVYSPMRLPLLGPYDPRSEYSPWWSIQNVQATKKIKNTIEIFGGVKNLLNWTPQGRNPFLIARSHDPFDRDVQYDAAGNIQRTPANPYALTFDPTYVYGPNQGIRFFVGMRWSLM